MGYNPKGSNGKPRFVIVFADEQEHGEFMRQLDALRARGFRGRGAEIKWLVSEAYGKLERDSS